MANITIKLSQAALDAGASASSISGEAGGTINGVLDAALTINNLINDNYYYYSSVSASSNQVVYRYSDGASVTLNGSLDNPGLGYGWATITKSTFSKSGALSVETIGSSHAYFDRNGGYETNYGTVNSFKVSVLDGSISAFGKTASTISGQINFDSSDNLSGTINRITTSASKILKSSEITGNFTINSGNASNPYDYYSNGVIGRYSNVSGTLTKYTENYYDGSFTSVDFSSTPLAIDNNETIDFIQLSDPNNLPNDDKLDISLPSNIYNEVIIRTGAGNDSITLAGGGGNLHLDTGSGNDVITITSGDHYIITGLGNDTINGGNGVETLVYVGKQSDYAIEKLTNGKLVIKSSEKTDTAYKVEWLEFSDGKVSSASLPVKNAAPTGTVTLSGIATQGQRLTAANTLADADGLGTISYQWLADGSAINRATGSTFTLTQSQVGKAISVKASYTDKFGTAESVTSSATAQVANLNDLPTGAVTISGSAKQGQTLTASNNLVDADGFETINYQWLADGKAISGATGSTLTLDQTQVGKAISVKASYSDRFGASESVTSKPMAKIANVNDAPTGSVTITGTAAQNQTLRASNDLADIDGLGTIAYQWFADGSVIKGAAASTFTLTQAQVGKAVTVKASYTDKFGTAESVTSAVTDKIVNINDAPTGMVTITGTASQGQKLTAANKLADADGLGTIFYQWLANGSDIGGATASTFTLTQAQVGKTISVKASYTDNLGTAESVTSATTAMIASASKTGTAANDLLVGSAGKDTLIGGAGADQLTGGAGSDSFKFTALADLGLGAAARDVITDFKRSEGDKIDLAAIDTNSALKGDQKFAWVTDFGTTAGQVRFAADGQGNGIVYLNTDTDSDAEFEIMLTGVTTLAATDLIL